MDPASTQNRQNVPVGPARSNNQIIKWAIVAAGGLIVAFVVLLQLLIIGLNTGIWGLLIGIVIAVLPVPIYLALALTIDRYEREPIWMLATAFLWGATVATFISIIINTLFGFLVGSIVGPEIGELLSASISAPIVEETSKGLALFILFFWKKDEFDGVIDGIVYAAMVGLGFAMTENFLYYGRAFVEGGIEGSLLLFVIRGVLSPFNHPLFTAMTGIGLGLSRQTDQTWVKYGAPLAGLLAAITLHFLWNSASVPLALLGLPEPIVILTMLVLLAVPMVVGVLAVVFFSLRREGHIVRHYLTPELQSGLLSREEYETLGSVLGRIRSSFRALSSGGFGAWRARARFNQAASELAFHRDRVSRGITSGEDAQHEVTYLQLMRGSR